MNLIYKKVLITAIDSFTGKHLSQYLQQFGYEVFGTSYPSCDISKKEDIKKALKDMKLDYIIHLAGISFVAHRDLEEFYKVNTIGTINLLDTILELNLNPKKVILASSATVYGDHSLEVLDESLCPKPANHYGASKYAMECLASQYFLKLPIIITRPFNYTGIGQEKNFLIPKIVSHYKENKKTIELGNLDVSREFNDVGYICEIYKRLLESETKSEIVNICSNRPIKLLDIIEIMDNIAKYKITVKVNPDFVRKDDIKTLTGSKKKIEHLIGSLSQKSLQEMLEDMFKAL